MKALTLTTLLATTLLAGCRISTRTIQSGFAPGIQLAAQSGPDGHDLRWKLYPGFGTSPRIDRTESATETVARIGLTVGPVNRERAQSVGTTAFRGVWVTEVEPGSPAATVGVAPGDIVLAVNGVEMSSREQYEDYLVQNAVVGEPLVHRLRVYRRSGEPLDREQTADVEILPVGKEVRETSTDSIPLESSSGILSYTGMQVASVPAELCREMYGEERGRTLVSAVQRGTPAYWAGIRPGDRVLACDGEPVESLDDLRAAVAGLADQQHLKGNRHDLAKVEGTERKKDSSSKLAIDVDGPLGRHSARLGVDDELEDETHVYVPILLDYDSDIRSAKVSFLDFIFQFGFNYRSRVRDSNTRDSVETWFLSLFPFGMFEIERGVTGNRYTLFWLIDFETRR